MSQSRHWLFLFSFIGVSLAGAISLASAWDIAVTTADHVRVEYDGIDARHATAIAKTISAARQVYIDLFKFEMPESIHVKVDCGPKQPSRLFTDGKDRVFLSLPSANALAPPRQSGTFTIYGLCHETGHIAMYRALIDRNWMTNAAAEGWAHYAGSLVVDRVYDKEGEHLWPTPYNYRADGTARLREQLASRNVSGTALGASQWQRLADILGEARFPKLFEAWQEAKIDPLDPNAMLLSATTALVPEQRGKVDAWWKTAAPLFVEARQKSDVEGHSVKPAELIGKPIAVANDDGTNEGKRSIAGGGHARLFEAPGPEFYLTSVSFYGARYGSPKAPDQDFEIALCDEQLRPIANWKKPYAAVQRGELRWIKTTIPPTRVPSKFHICLVFNPSASQGVYIGHDSSTKGHSHVGTPGKVGKPLPDADWMIRLELDQRKESDALGTVK